jgi:UDP-N-acetylmuramoylalanine--D-glutamate ligase
MISAPVFAGRQYAVLGLARSGAAAVETLLASGAKVTAWDSREEPRQALAARHGDKIEFGDPATIDLTNYAGVVVSPGVPINRHPIGAAAAIAGVPLIGDIELFALARSSISQYWL